MKRTLEYGGAQSDRSCRSALMVGLLLVACPAGLCAGTLDLSHAVVVTSADPGKLEIQAARMLVEEVEKRSGMHWSPAKQAPESPGPWIAVGTVAELKQMPDLASVAKELTDGPPEGFNLIAVKDTGRGPGAIVAGNDPRGVMFGVGRLLRELEMDRSSVALADNLSIHTAPHCRLRGHQLGYRPKTNSYDAWDVDRWEQYFRDLIVFGCNAIELIPPRSDDDASSPHFPRPPMEMMIEMSRLADRYGLDVWIWYPAMDKDYADPTTVQRAVKEWGAVFRQLPRVDAVFVPGGDPGHTAPKPLMALLEAETQNLHQFHPRAGMWVSPQSFNREWMDDFLRILQQDRPTWLSGLVFGPQVRMPLRELREAVPSQYPIRHYPDITHSRQCQYPVPDWDVAYALTEARECINPRPTDEAAIFHAADGDTIGFITYSEGCNDDVNKAVWSALGWDPARPVPDILREYGRYFIGARVADDFAQGLLALERDWRGPLLSNAAVETTFLQFQSMERSATPQQRANWRFQQALFRAYYDVYTRRRLIFETELEQRALEQLRRAPDQGALASITAADQMLNESQTRHVAPECRERILELGAALFQSIGMQLSVAKYQAIAMDRGAALDTLEYPLNNRVWLKEQFGKIRRLGTEPERLKALHAIVDWENPGPGGFYDDLGNSGREPHLLRRSDFAADPGSMHSPRNGFEEDLVWDEDDPPPQGTRRISWMDHAETLYDTPLELHYAGLDPKAAYTVRVVYAGDNPRREIRLVANDTVEIHGYIRRPFPFAPMEFRIPPAETRSGTLTLSWFGEPGLGGNGRGCQVSEVWLVKGPARP